MARSTNSPGIVVDPAAAVARGGRRRPLVLNLFISLRPGHWTKNLLVFAGLLFGQRLLEPRAVAAAAAAFVIFCALSGVVYLINDLADRESDRQHPLKAKRPIASGALPVGGATPLSAKACARAYAVQCARIAEAGGVPVIFPSPGTRALDDAGLIALFGEIASSVDRFVAFELGEMFNPNGGMFSEPVLTGLMKMPQCIGLKHSSLERGTEIARLKLRDRVRTDFAIYSGNDLAPDMIEYGSDYLLGLSTFAPELFVARDRAWSAGARSYLELRDLIQYLGWIGFREPVPAYKHSAAIFLKLTGSLECDEPHPRAPRREDWDRGILADASRRLRRLMPSETGSS